DVPVVAVVSVITLFLFVRFVGVPSDRHEGYTLGQVHQLDTHCVPIARAAHGLHGSPHDSTSTGDREEFIIRVDHHCTHQRTPALCDLGGEDSLSAAALNRVLLDRSPLRVSAVGRHQDIHTLTHHLDREQLVRVGEPHADHPGGGAAHRAKDVVGGLEPDGLCLSTHPQQVVLRADQLCADQLVTVA